MRFKLWLNERSYNKYDVEKFANQTKLDISKYEMDELVKGINIEKEHKKDKKLDVVGKDESKLLKIALAHLEEDPHYYKKLLKADL